MSTPAGRLLTMIELLQAHRSMSGREIADRLGVDIRTVRRYILMLEDLGIPIAADRGKDGGYRLMPGYKLPPLMFNEDEVLAVLLGLVAAKRIGLSPTHDADIERAQAKITRILSESLRGRMAALESTLVWDWNPPGWQKSEVNSEVVLALAVCARHHVQTMLEYRAFDGTLTERLIDPYGLVCRYGRWYVTGYCHLRSAIRLFRMDRIRSAKSIGTTFDRPHNFDVLTEVTLALGTVKRAFNLDVLLTTSMEYAQQQISAGVAVLEETADGRVRLRGYTDRPEFMARMLASIGCTMEIIDPPELRSAVTELAHKLLDCAAK